MAETKPGALKSFFSPALVQRLAAELQLADPQFPGDAFVKTACAGLQQLELLERGRQLCRALRQHLPQEYPSAIELLLRSLGAPHQSDELLGGGMAPFFYLPHVLFVAEHGLEHFDLSLRAQYELTQRFSAEFSIRYFIERDPERTLTALHEWSRDDNAHVRRLASEGTRLRLPWAMRVRWLDDHPERVLALLERLKDDPSSMVRRSVANNLNDLGKVHPQLLTDTCARWLEDASAERRALVEHALRSAVKRGEPNALRLLGYGGKAAVAVESVRFEPARVSIGSRVALSFVLRSTARKPQELLVDLAVHFVKASGRATPKVFKLKRVTLPARGQLELSSRISLAVHTTRKPQPGQHAVDVLVNGVAFPAGAFQVVAARRA
ncbi:MAG: hypothetical protein RL685_6679 [Pseudomonadota bacterium]|jgi:3-methyladenine DNA glycosylase AlkC